ncbi:hypothetical protein ILYODFUR_018142 [Ilyodon furcidens]|uniref:Uncharacterized protein n=1 Tax=Ilyodon furcidens TaxID=33524 RepID=A0ABV0VFH2_9TELE
MEQKAVETTQKADVKDKGIVNIHEDNTAWTREERLQSQDQASTLTVTVSAENKPGVTSGDLKQQGESVFPLKPRQSSFPSSGTTIDLSSSPKSNMGG